jgi:F-type H+-transporting ATPase subunit a
MQHAADWIVHGLASADAHGEGSAHHGSSFLGTMLYVGLTVVIVLGLLTYAVAKINGTKGLRARVMKNPVAASYEQVYLFIEQMCVGTVGPHGRKYVPMILTFWLVIFVSNLLSLVMPTAPTADLSFNLALAVMAVGYVQWEGMRANGVLGHFKHFAGPKLPIYMIPVTLMIFVIEIVSEMMKNVSLSLRLFGNIEGGHQAAEAMNKLGASILTPIGAFLLPIKLLTCVVQAMVFTLLTCVYLSLVTHHDEGHAEAAAH